MRLSGQVLLLVVASSPSGAGSGQQHSRLCLRHGQLFGQQQVLLREESFAANDIGAIASTGNRALGEFAEQSRKSRERKNREDQSESRVIEEFRIPEST